MVDVTTKEDFVKSLKNVKLIIGNGFDLHCGLHTKYSDFYCKNIDKYQYISKKYKTYKQTDEVDFKSDVSKFSVWDIFFCLNSSEYPEHNSKSWCDIESLMLSSLLPEDFGDTPEKLSLYIDSTINWDAIKKCFTKRLMATNHTDRFILEFINAKMEMKPYRLSEFYKFLLDELKEFEKSFGKFIYSQLHQTWYERCNHGKEFLHEPYIKMAMDTINSLVDLNNLVAVDSFNYGDIRDQRIINKLQNINGNISSPIFGVDSIFEPKDEKFIFTKTGRRIDADLFQDNFQTKSEFENIVIFGHSLNEADYSYFFPLFDKMKLTDIFSNNTIVFAYSIFDRNRENKIKANLRNSISNLLYAYALDKKITNPKRFLDSLSTQKRIITYEIPLLNREEYGFTLVDEEWKEIFRKIDSLCEE